MTVICESVFVCVTWWQKYVVGKPVNPKCGLRVECVGNRHDDIDPSFYSLRKSVTTCSKFVT